MPTDWAGRLDSRGYHRVTVTREDTAAEWFGATRKAEDDWVEGDAIKAYDATGETSLVLRVGDAVYMSGPRKGAPAEIALIESLYSAPGDDHIWVRARFYWRPERMGKVSATVDWDLAELFAAENADENSAASIELTPVVVKQLGAPPPSAPHMFFSHRTYNVSSHEISGLPGTSLNRLLWSIRALAAFALAFAHEAHLLLHRSNSHGD